MVMKKFILLAVISTPIFAQMNPDGYIGGLTINARTFYTSDHYKYEIAANKFGYIENDGNLIFGLSVKYPHTSSATLGVHFDYSNAVYINSEYGQRVLYDGYSYRVGLDITVYIK